MEVSSAIAAELDSGVRAPAFIAKDLGGTRDKPNLGRDIVKSCGTGHDQAAV